MPEQELIVTGNGGTLTTDQIDYFSKYDGGGTENMEAEDQALPYLILLQALSPQLDSSNAAYIDGAKAGMFLNTVTGELFKELEVIPCAFAFRVIERTSRDEGNQFIARHTREEAEPLKSGEKSDKGVPLTESGSLLIDTAYHYVLQLVDGLPTPAVISLKSSGLKKSKQWVGKIKALKVRVGGNIVTPPSFASLYKITSGQEVNGKGDKYKGIIIERLGYILDAAILEAGAEFAQHAIERKLASDETPEEGTEKQADTGHSEF